MIAIATKKCTGCGGDKPLDDFYRQSKTADGRRAKCKVCSEQERDKWSRPKNGYRLVEEKFCARCEQTKSADDFYQNVRHCDHLSTYCKLCTAALRTNYSKEERRNFMLKCNYGVSGAQVDQMLVEQGGKCAICGTTTPGNSNVSHFSVDHDHVTGEVRGLLCEKCNRGLGHYDDSPALLEAAARYLREHSNKAASPMQSP